MLTSSVAPAHRDLTLIAAFGLLKHSMVEMLTQWTLKLSLKIFHQKLLNPKHTLFFSVKLLSQGSMNADGTLCIGIFVNTVLTTTIIFSITFRTELTETLKPI